MLFEQDDKLCKQDIKSFEQHIKSSEQKLKNKTRMSLPGFRSYPLKSQITTAADDVHKCFSIVFQGK